MGQTVSNNVPAFVVVGLGVNATNALVISQVVLSLALPLPMIALLIFTRSDLMGQFRNSRITNILALIGTVLVLSLNAFLILQTLGVGIPGLSDSAQAFAGVRSGSS